jgi:hypothetical protein
MSQSTNILVNFVAEYKGRQQFKSAEKDMGLLGKSIEKLGKTFAAVFAVEKVLEFGKNAVEAFSADEKSAKILTNTLGNLGLAFSNVPVENFITKLSEVNGIAKTDLRNSFDTLVRSTGDAAKAQDLLNLGLDVSAGTGKDLSLVTVALAKAYGGNFAAISKLGAGITKAEIKTGDFAKIQEHLASVFKGDAATAAETFSGKIARLKTSFEEFKITIGSGLTDAFASLTANGDIKGLQDAMGTVATDVADIVRGLGVVGGEITGILSKLNGFSGGALGKILAVNFRNSLLGQLLKLGKDSKKVTEDAANAAKMKIPQGPFAEGYTTVADHAKYVAAQKKLADDKAKALKAELDAQKKITDQKNKQMALDRAALSLKLAGSVADLQNIEIQAALQRGQSADVVNVLLLQRALLNNNADQANILAQEVLKANGLVMDVNGNIYKIGQAPNPFNSWPTATQQAKDELQKIQDQLAALHDKLITITVQTVTTDSGSSVSTANGVAGTTKLASGAIAGLVDAQGFTYMQPAAGAPQIDPSKFGSGIVTYDQANFSKGASAYYDKLAGVNSATTGTQPIAVTVNLNGQAVGNAITNAQVDQSASGIANSFQRSGYGSGALPW